MILLYSTAEKSICCFPEGGDSYGSEGCPYPHAYVWHVYTDTSGLYEKKIDRPGKVTVYRDNDDKRRTALGAAVVQAGPRSRTAPKLYLLRHNPFYYIIMKSCNFRII